MAMSCWPKTRKAEIQNDITHFHPLYQQTVVALGHFPTYLTGDAAFDAWHVHEVAVRHGGIAAVPLKLAWPSGLPARR
jgi:hypothetical protein